MQTTTTPVAPVRERLLMDFDWRFHLGALSIAESVDDDPHAATYNEAKTGFARGPANPAFDDSGWCAVDLPHYWAVKGALDPANNKDHGFLPVGVGWYRKQFNIPASDEGRVLYLELVRFGVSPNTRIIGVGNGDPSCHEPDKASQRTMFNGLVQVIAQAASPPGDIELTAEVDGLQWARLVIPAQACERRPAI